MTPQTPLDPKSGIFACFPGSSKGHRPFKTGFLYSRRGGALWQHHAQPLTTKTFSSLKTTISTFSTSQQSWENHKRIY